MKQDGADARRPRRRKGLEAVKTIFDDYRSRLVRRAERARKRLIGHAVVFGATNLFLLLINVVVGLSFPWFLFPLGGWAILLAGHLVLAEHRQRQGGEVAALEELSTYQTRILKRFHRRRSAFAVTSWSSLATALFLGMTNLLVSPQFPWAVITAGSLGLVELIYYLSHSSRRRALLAQMSEELPSGSVELLTRHPGRLFGSLGRKADDSSREIVSARGIRSRIGRQLTDLGIAHAAVGEEITSLLDRCLEQIVELVRRRDEVASLCERSTTEPIERERERLSARLEESLSEPLRTEYRRSVDQLDQQLTSIRRLQDHLQIAELRLDAALNSLRQLEIDVVRMKGLPDFGGGEVSKVLQDQTEELARYLEDMKAGWNELE